MNIFQFWPISKILLLLKQPIKWLILIVCLYSLASCEAIEQYSRDINLQNWKYADVRLLDFIDANEPSQDLIAVYSRTNDRSVQLRVDFLEMPSVGKQDFYFLLDTNPGGSPNVRTDSGQDFIADINWDYLIRIPGKGNVSIFDDHYRPIGRMALLIMREPSLESLMLNFNKNSLPITIGRTFLQIFVTSPGNNQILDKTDRFSMDAPSPAVGKVLFAFWNTFSSATPAQALRSWAGAHAGPVSSRHGLKYLFETADRTQTPIFLPDLFTPENLSALDYLGALPEISKLIYGSVIYSPNEKVTRQINNDDSLFNDSLSYLIEYNELMSVSDYAQSLNTSQCLQLSLENNLVYQINSYLLSCKRLLLQNAIDHPTLPMIIGGDFSESLLGDPNISTELFGFIASHPWIQVVRDVNINDYRYSPEKTTSISSENPENSSDLSVKFEGSSIISSEINKSLTASPESKITYLAKHIFQSLTQHAPLILQNLRSHFIGQIGYLLKANEWVNNPVDMASCDNDLDYDGQNECLLTNSNIFIAIDLNGGYIPFVFSKDAQGVHQIIGPTWEFLVGISDRSEWDNSKGLHSDPGQILGAFADNISEWKSYNYIINDNEIVLIDDDMSMRKSIIISPESLHVTIHSTRIKNGYFYIPLVVDPWVRYYPDWGNLYFSSKSSNSFEWGITSGQKVQISTTTQANFYAFNDSRSTITHDEDPNFDYTRGHYLPFPMSLVEISTGNDLSVDINLKP
jgi:hypothetical protein